MRSGECCKRRLFPPAPKATPALSTYAFLFGILLLALSACRDGAEPTSSVGVPYIAGRSEATRSAIAGSGRGLSNRLSAAGSPYLRSAAQATVSWQPFDEVAFRLAQSLDRPILLDVGASWCHWCRVMERESYSDPAVAALINERFVPIKVDADERPDLDRRFQQAAQVISRRAGWPLTLFLTPSGQVFSGGTYFPVHDRAGLPGFKSVVEAAFDAFEDETARFAADQADRKLGLLAAAGVVAGTPDRELVDQIGEAILEAMDPENGGLGRGAKAPPSAAIELALDLYRRSGDRRYLELATLTLDKMADGAIRDQLGGGFHRLTLDPTWQRPHFELLSSVNAAVLLNYLHAYQLTGLERYRTVALEIIGYLDGTLGDGQRGGLFAGQDGDVGPNDDGDYYTWTVDEFAAILPADEALVAARHYGVAAQESTVAAERAALRVAEPVDRLARGLSQPEDQVRARVESARQHLRRARAQRQAPAVDRTFYSDRNGLLVSAYLEASRILGYSGLRDSALRTLDRLAALSEVEGLVSHAHSGTGAVAPPLLDDQLAVARAFLDAFELTGDRRHLALAGNLLDWTVAVFGDPLRGGFYDVAGPPGPGSAAFRLKPYDDAQFLGGNALAAMVLDQYAMLSGRPEYRDLAGDTLRAFAGAAREYGPFAAGYALALSRHLE